MQLYGFVVVLVVGRAVDHQWSHCSGRQEMEHLYRAVILLS